MELENIDKLFSAYQKNGVPVSMTFYIPEQIVTPECEPNAVADVACTSTVLTLCCWGHM